MLDTLVRARPGRDLARLLYRLGVARDAIDATLARELDAIAETTPPRLRLVESEPPRALGSSGPRPAAP